MGNVVVDLREVSEVELSRFDTPSPGFLYLMNSWQYVACRGLRSRLQSASQIIIMVPDFLYYARLANTGRPAEILKLPGSFSALMRSGIRSVPTGFAQLKGLATGRFWSAARALTSYDIGLLPVRYDGEVILHQNLADFSCFFDQQSFLEYYFQRVPKRLIRGVSTQQADKALSACARANASPDRLLQLAGSRIVEPSPLHREAFPQTTWTYDVTLWPIDRQVQALRQVEDADYDLLVTSAAWRHLLRLRDL